MTYILISALLVVIGVLCWLIGQQAKCIHHLEDLNHRDRVDSRARYLETINHCHEEYRALTESYVRHEGKVFITPVSRFENDDELPSGGRRQPDPPTRAFAKKPNPPIESPIIVRKDTV